MNLENMFVIPVFTALYFLFMGMWPICVMWQIFIMDCTRYRLLRVLWFLTKFFMLNCKKQWMLKFAIIYSFNNNFFFNVNGSVANLPYVSACIKRPITTCDCFIIINGCNYDDVAKIIYNFMSFWVIIFFESI